MHFLAVCGIDPVAQALQDVFTYTPVLAQVLWILHLLLLEVALPLRAWPKLELQARTHVRAVAEQV
jgi:hypothetical protein